MGIKGLWPNIQPVHLLINPQVARNVKLDSLSGQILAIDASIWLYHFIKAIRDPVSQTTLPNAHVLGFLRRICKLLFFNIKPVFVFDGPKVPALKRNVLKERRRRKVEGQERGEKSLKRIMGAKLKKLAVEHVQKEMNNEAQAKIKKSPVQTVPPAYVQNNQESTDTEELDFTLEQGRTFQLEDDQLENINIDSKAFIRLPKEHQQELLLELRTRSRQTSWDKLSYILQAAPSAKDFSKLQIKNLVRRNELWKRLDDFQEKEKNENEKVKRTLVIQKRIATEKNREYLLVKNPDNATWSLRDYDPEKQDFHEWIEEKEEVTTEPENQMKILNDTRNQNFLLQFKDELPRDKEMDLDIIFQNAMLELPLDASKEEEDFIQEQIYTNTLEENQEAFYLYLKRIEKSSSNSDVKNLKWKKEFLLKVIEAKLLQQDALNLKIKNEKLETKSNISEEAEVNDIILDETIPAPVVQTSEVEKEGEELIFEEKKEDILPAQIIRSEKVEKEILSKKGIENIQPIIEIVDEPEESQILEEKRKEAEAKKEKPVFKEPEKVKTKSELFQSIHEENVREKELTPEPIFEQETFSEPEMEQETSNVSVEKIPEPTEEIEDNLEKELEDDEEDIEMENEDFSQFMAQVQNQNLSVVQSQIESEIESLRQQLSRDNQAASSVDSDMIRDVQILLNLFGIPFITASGEAEAQCAYLFQKGLVQGIITDDSDVFLFGGDCIYRNIFQQSKYIEFYKMDDLQEYLHLNRERLIQLAYLLGCDYTEGVFGVGGILGMEIIAEWPGEKLEGLSAFAQWWQKLMEGELISDSAFQNKFQTKAKRLLIDDHFPNPKIWDAFMQPDVEEVKEKFNWKFPNLEGLRKYLSSTLHWSMEKIDGMILPIIKNLSKKYSNQMTLEHYFNSPNAKMEIHLSLKPKLKAVIDKLSDPLGTPQTKLKLLEQKEKKKINKRSLKTCSSGEEPPESPSPIKKRQRKNPQPRLKSLKNLYEESYEKYQHSK